MYPVPGDTYRFRIDEQEGSFTFDLGGDERAGSNTTITLAIDSRESGEGLCRASTSSGQAGRSYAFAWAWVGPDLHLWLDGALYVFQRVETRRRGESATAEMSGDILAPMPGTVLEVLVSEGDRVERNQTVAVMESMKMELLITAFRDGVVRRVSVQAGQQVERGMRLLELAPERDAEE